MIFIGRVLKRERLFWEDPEGLPHRGKRYLLFDSDKYGDLQSISIVVWDKDLIKILDKKNCEFIVSLKVYTNIHNGNIYNNLKCVDVAVNERRLDNGEIDAFLV